MGPTRLTDGRDGYRQTQKDTDSQTRLRWILIIKDEDRWMQLDLEVVTLNPGGYLYKKINTRIDTDGRR